MPKSKHSASRMTREQRRAQLIDVALDIFAEHGYAQTTMDEVALHAAVSKPVLYQHFHNKRDLYFTLIDVELDALRDAITSRMQAVNPNADDADEQQVYQAVYGVFEFTSDPRGLYRLILDTTMDNPAELEERKQQFLEELVEFISPYLLDNSILSPTSSEFIAGGIASVVIYMAVRWAEHYAHDESGRQSLPLDIAVENTFRLVAHGAIGFDLSNNPSA